MSPIKGPSRSARVWRRLAGVTLVVVLAHLLVLVLSLEGLGQRWHVPRWSPPPVQTWTVSAAQTPPRRAVGAVAATDVATPSSELRVPVRAVQSAPEAVNIGSSAGSPPSDAMPQQPTADGGQPALAVSGEPQVEPSVSAPEAVPSTPPIGPNAAPASERPAVTDEPPGGGDRSATALPEIRPAVEPNVRPEVRSQFRSEGAPVGSSRPEDRPEVLPTAPSPAAASNKPAAVETATEPPPPLYRAQLPPPFLWRYTLRRGALSGSADLHFERSGDAYALDLRGTVIGLEVLGQRSQGATSLQGLEPARFVERRMGRDRMSANFDRALGQISYSGPTALKPLLPGAQDRLSWMVQLGAVIAADPDRFVPGSVVLMSITGVRADVDTWAFQVQGVEQLKLPSGVVNRALRIFRQPRQPYDTQIDVWLDPQRHHLPVQARMTVLPSRDRLDLVLDP